MKRDTKLKQEAEQLTLTGLEINGSANVPNAIIKSPTGTRIIKVNATPEALEMWKRAGWKWRWIMQEEL